MHYAFKPDKYTDKERRRRRVKLTENLTLCSFSRSGRHSCWKGKLETGNEQAAGETGTALVVTITTAPWRISDVNTGTTKVRTNFHVNTDFYRNGRLYGWGGGANSSPDISFPGLRMIISTAGGQRPQDIGTENLVLIKETDT